MRFGIVDEEEVEEGLPVGGGRVVVLDMAAVGLACSGRVDFDVLAIV